MLHVSIKPEVIFEIAGFPVTNSIFASWVLIVLFLFIGIYFSQNYSSKRSKPIFFSRFLLKKLHDFFIPIIGKVGDHAFPVIASIFLFVLLANWMGLLPGFGSLTLKESEHVEHAIDEVEHSEDSYGADDHGDEDHSADDHSDEDHSGAVATTDDHGDDEEHHAAATPVLRGATADLNTTLALALVSFVMIQFYGLRELKFGYLKKFIDFSSPINFFIGILEIISEISKIISFAFRLFGNIFAGEVLLVVIAFLIPVLASFPFLLLEVFVGVVQALVFAMLTAVFINLSTTAHH